MGSIRPEENHLGSILSSNECNTQAGLVPCPYPLYPHRFRLSELYFSILDLLIRLGAYLKHILNMQLFANLYLFIVSAALVAAQDPTPTPVATPDEGACSSQQ